MRCQNKIPRLGLQLDFGLVLGLVLGLGKPCFYVELNYN